jgi:hypothetical protein
LPESYRCDWREAVKAIINLNGVETLTDIPFKRIWFGLVPRI